MGECGDNEKETIWNLYWINVYTEQFWTHPRRGCRVFCWAVHSRILHTHTQEISYQPPKTRMVIWARGWRHLCQGRYVHAFQKALPNIVVGRCGGPCKWLCQKNTSAAYRWLTNRVDAWQVWRDHPFEGLSRIWYTCFVVFVFVLLNPQKYLNIRSNNNQDERGLERILAVCAIQELWSGERNLSCKVRGWLFSPLLQPGVSTWI